MSERFVDLVVAGCDFSGTTTQIAGLIKHLQSKGKIVRDIRGTEIDAMFHAEVLADFNKGYTTFDEFIKKAHPFIARDGINQVERRVHENKFNITSMVRNGVSVYINPESADAWIMEEPTHRGAGQTVRSVELYRSKFEDKVDQISAALAHQTYRTEEFLRFRRVLREAGKLIVRSRSEESACYNIKDEEASPQGISREQYLSLPGHKIAFGNAPTHIFVVHGPADWDPADYICLRTERAHGRVLDDLEHNFRYQLMVNRRYATDWLERLYEEGCAMHGGKVPQIFRINIYDSPESQIQQMADKLDSVLAEKAQ